MEVGSLIACFVVTADQRGSRRNDDQVPAALEELATRVGHSMRLGFERTAGDEIQGLTDDVAAVTDTVVTLSRLGQWRIGIGYGAVEQPLPKSTRAARGPAYLLARAAIDSARKAPGELSVRSAKPSADVAMAEAALQVLRALLRRRTSEGWTAVGLLESGLSMTQISEKLGVSVSAVSQRLTRASYAEGNQGIALANYLLGAVAKARLQ